MYCVLMGHTRMIQLLLYSQPSVQYQVSGDAISSSSSLFGGRSFFAAHSISSSFSIHTYTLLCFAATSFGVFASCTVAVFSFVTFHLIRTFRTGNQFSFSFILLVAITTVFLSRARVLANTFVSWLGSFFLVFTRLLNDMNNRDTNNKFKLSHIRVTKQHTQ